MTIEQIEHEALRLPDEQRAELLNRLWHSLEGDSPLDLDDAWIAEAEERLAAFDRGELVALEGDQTLDALVAKLS